ncbi:AMP-binding protein [Streptomyces sp. NPDC058657]|uniref:AMP-binding protein n=1 Tax=unclassified Streptomyces TaxID=2593676 RepID=UPI003658E71D
MVVRNRVTDLPSAEYTSHFLTHRVVPAAAGPQRPLGFDDARHALSQADLPPGAVVVIAVADSLTQLTLFLAALHQDLVPVLLPRACPRQRIRLVADALGAGALVTPATAAGTRTRTPVALTRWNAPRPQLHNPGQAIVMTSGTSGLASGCLHHVSSLLANARLHGNAIGLRSSDSLLVNLPLNYSFALVAQALAALALGARLVLGGPPFGSSAYHHSLQHHGITVSSLSPSLVRTFLGDQFTLPRSLRTLTVGGDALEAVHVRELLRRHRDGEVYLTYGLTEAGPRVSTLAAHREPPERHTSVGLPLPGVTTRIERLDPARDEGELVVTTPTAMVRRVGSEPAGRRGLVAPGTIATSDVFHLDESGYLSFRGRLADFVLINGDKVSLRWVRDLVGSLPGVLHVRTEIVRTPPTRSGSSGQKYRLHVLATEATDRLRARIEHRLKEVLLRVEFPCELLLTDEPSAAFTK